MLIIALIILQLVLLFLSSRQLQGQMSGLFLHITRRQKPAIWLMALTFLPGTVIHELSHYLVARILLVKASAPHLWPKIEHDRIVMGHVMVPKVDPIRMFLIGIAPFIVGLAILGSMLWFGYTHQWWTAAWYWQAILGYAIFQISNSLFLSGADLKQMIRLVLILLIIAALTYLLGFRLQANQLPAVIDQYQQLLTMASLLLAIPIVLNVVIITIFAILTRLLRR